MLGISICLPVDSNVTMCGDKSYADDLNVRPGIVRGRVALLLRSTEIKPELSDLCKAHYVTVGGRQLQCSKSSQTFIRIVRCFGNDLV